MAYGSKYENLCKSKDGNTYTLKLLFDGYTGAVVDRDIPQDSPIVLRKDKAAVIRGTSCEFAIREAVDFEMDEFYTNVPKKIKAELYKGATQIWSGYNLAQQYRAPYIPAPATIRFTATDGLGLLKAEPFTLTGLNSQLAIIIHCIDKIALGLAYSIAVNLWETNHDHDRSPLAQTYEDAEIYEDKDCYTVLENILSKYDADITQVNNKWHITRSADKKSTRMLYTAAGVYDTTEAAPAVLDLGYKGAGIEVWPIGRLERSMEPGGRKVVIKHDLGRRASLLSNFEFWRYSAGQFTDWTQSGSFTLSQRIKDGKAYAFLEGYSNVNSHAIAQEIEIDNEAACDFVFEVDFAPVGRLSGGVNGLSTVQMLVRFVISLSDGVDTYYLTKAGWTTVLTTIDETVTASLSTPVWNRLKIVTAEIPISGTLSVNLYRYYLAGSPAAGVTYTGIAFSEPLVYFLIGGELHMSGTQLNVEFDDSTEPGDLGEINIIAADGLGYANEGLMYYNLTRLSDGTPTALWHREGESPVVYGIRVQLAKLLASNNRIARDKLMGTIKASAALSFNNLIKHTYNSSKEFEIAEAVWDVYNGSYDVTLLEFLAWSDEDITPTTENENGGSTTAGSSGGSLIGISLGTEGGVTSAAAADILTKILTVDGSGSGLDADLLDGEHGSFYAPIDSPSFTTEISVTGDAFISGRVIAGGLATLDSEASFQAKIDLTLDYQYLLRFKDEAGAIGFLITNGAAAGSFFPVFTGKVTSTLPGLYFVGNCVNGPGAGAPIVGFDGRVNNAAAAASDILIGFSSGYGNIKAGILGNGTIYTAGGIHVGGTSDPGVDNLLVDGTCEITGISTFTGLIKTAGGVHIGGTSDPGADNLIVDGTSLISGIATFANDLGTASFSSGFAGSGWKMDYNTDYSLTVDNLTVRKKMRVYELEVNKIKSVNGGIMVSVANGKAYSVSNTVEELNDWGYNTFTSFASSGLEISACTNNAGNYGFAYDATGGVGSAYTATTGEIITVTGFLTLNSGTAPQVLWSGTGVSANLAPGANSVNLSIVSGGGGVVIIRAGASPGLATNFSFTGVTITSNIQKIVFDEDEATAGTGNLIQFEANDYIRAQEWTGRGVDSYVGKVLSVVHSATLGSAYIRAISTDVCWAGAELVQVGNSTETDRQSMIYITASDTNNPYIDILSGVTDGDFTGHIKARLGNLTGITDAYLGALSGYGLWSDNVYLTGKVVLPSAGITNEGSAASSVRIYAGDTYENRATAPFRVLQDGKMTATAGAIAGWTINSTSLSASTTAIAGAVTVSIEADGDATLKDLYLYGNLGYYNYSQQSTPYSPTAANLPLYVCLDNASESTFNLPSSGLPGSGSSRILIIVHKYGTGLGAGKYHIQGNGYSIIDGGSSVSSIDITEGHCAILTWEPRGTCWYVTSKN